MNDFTESKMIDERFDGTTYNDFTMPKMSDKRLNETVYNDFTELNE